MDALTHAPEGTLANSLPFDILYSIFLLLHPTDFKECGYPIKTPAAIVSHVCRLWRASVLSIPLLWSFIDFPTARYTPLHDHWLARSGQGPLDISITYPESEDDKLPEAAYGLVNKLIAHVHRWRGLSFYGGSEPVLETLMEKCRLLAAPQLAFMKFEERNIAYEPSWSLGTLEGGTPKLRQVHVHNAHIDWNAPYLLNLTTLRHSVTSFHYTNAARPEVITSFLERCTNIEDLYLLYSRTPGFLVVLPQPFTRIPLPRLRKLEVMHEYLAAICATFQCPLITKFEILDTHFSFFRPPVTIPHHPFPNIHELGITYTSYRSVHSGTDLVDVLHGWPHLCTLKLDGAHFVEHDTPLDHLASDGSHGILCPRLQSLSLIDRHGFSIEDVVEFVKTWSDSTRPPLVSLTVHFPVDSSLEPVSGTLEAEQWLAQNVKECVIR
ncbi:hypothetical protein FRB99_002820 [Tulasnella sp. 403]|nr:hypothetical protein FRB99_002820 [Tulasnella sp. 403]